MASVLPTNIKPKLPQLQQHTRMKLIAAGAAGTARSTCLSSMFFPTRHQLHQYYLLNLKSRFTLTVLKRASNDVSGGSVDDNPRQCATSVSRRTSGIAQDHTSSDLGAVAVTVFLFLEAEAVKSCSNFGDGYVALFVRMLGLDNDPLDREQAIIALWKYSLGGRQCVENIMLFHGCLNLIVNLLKSESSSACEAAAGLLRSISSVNLYRRSVAESGAIEEITGLLAEPSLTAEVKEQSICVLWNLSVDENLRMKMANFELLPLLLKCLDDDDMKVKEAVGGVMSNLALSRHNHSAMVEASAIPKFARLLKVDVEVSKVLRKEARSALLELAKDEYYKVLVIEEGLIPVPLIGAAAYESFKPVSHSWPSLPDGTKLKRTSKVPSKYGAAELLLGLNIDDNDTSIDETKMKAIIGRTQQQFLARIGAIETEHCSRFEPESFTSQQFTLLPWMDGIARLVLILGLKEGLAVSKAAQSIADACINEYMRISFKEAGAVKHLVQLLDHGNNAVKLAATCALEKLAISNDVCQVIEEEGALRPLINTINNSEISGSLTEKCLNVIARILEPGKEMKLKFYDGPVNGSAEGLEMRGRDDGYTGIAGDFDAVPKSVSNSRRDVLGRVFTARLVEILKTSSPDLQIKASSVLEFFTIMEPSLETMISVDINSGLDAVIDQKILKGLESEERDGPQPEPEPCEVEEASHAISAASRLLTKLLDLKQFRESINQTRLAALLRKILKSRIPVSNKAWVAASLVKLGTFFSPDMDGSSSHPINTEVTLYVTIPRLVEQMKTSIDVEVREGALMELNRIVSQGMADSSRAVASNGGIFPLVKMIEEGSERAIEAGLALLYNVSIDDENHPAMMAAGAVPVLKRYAVAQRPHWMRALQLLRLLPTPPDISAE